MRYPCSLLLLFASTSFPAQADWPQWRGPAANMLAPEGDYPVEFSPGQNMLWQVDLGGVGSSTPVVWGDAVYLTLTDDGQDVAACYSLDGQQQWRKSLGNARDGKHRNGTGSNPSPVTDGQHVVVYFKSGLLACLSAKGEELWRVNLQEEYGPDTLWWDLGTSPVLTSAAVCVAVMQAGDSYLVTFDLETGNEVWKTQRQYERPEESDQAYTTPAVVNFDGRETIVTFGADYLTGHDATTGELLWERGGFNPRNKGMQRVIASATITDGLAIVPFGRAQQVAAVPLGPEKDTDEWLWKKEGIGADVPCPIVYNDHVYLLGDGGELSCLDIETGEVLAQERLPRARHKYYSSPLLAGDNLYCLREDGKLFVVSIAEGFELIAENDLGDESVSTPVPVDGTLLVRTREKLFRFGQQ